MKQVCGARVIVERASCISFVSIPAVVADQIDVG